jgi:hypothetical protein
MAYEQEDTRMPKLSAVGWMIHDLGLAAAIGGALYGQVAMHPALEKIGDPGERDRIAADSWRRFHWVNLASHAAFAVPWLVGRKMLSGKEAGRGSRRGTLLKDVLVGASLVSGVTSVVLGRILGRRIDRGAQPALGDGQSRRLEKTVQGVGLANLATNAAIAATTSALAMSASKSTWFSRISKRLP